MAILKIIPGDIIIVNNRDGNFLSKSIQFFTKGWSHTAFGFFDLPKTQTIFEANLTTGITDWKKTYHTETLDLSVYRWVKPTADMEKIMWALYDKYNGNVYGWGQLLYFIWRWAVESLGLPRRWAKKNFFPNNEICTEIIYVGLELMGDPVVNSVLAKLDRDQNTVHPADIVWICDELVALGKMKNVYERNGYQCEL